MINKRLIILSMFSSWQSPRSRFSLLLLLVSAAMLRPVLLCATLLLLTPFEVSEARALHPSPDAVQVFLGVGEDDKMYPWLNYPSVVVFILLPCSSWRSFWSATMTWLSTTWRTCWTARQRRSSPPSPPGSKGQSTPSGPTSSLNPRPPGSGCWRGPWPVRGERNRSAHGGAGTEDASAWNWIGSGPWADLAVSGRRGGGGGELRLMASFTNR